MKLLLSESLRAVMWKMVVVNAHACDGGKQCPSNEMRELIADDALLSSEKDFLRGLMCVQEDGRSCPASDQQDQIRKFLTDDWRQNLFLVTLGIRRAVVFLERSDIEKLNSGSES